MCLSVTDPCGLQCCVILQQRVDKLTLMVGRDEDTLKEAAMVSLQ